MAETPAPESPEVSVYVAPTSLIRGTPRLPSSKYYTLRYVLAAALAEGESTVAYPAASDDSEALFRGCCALGAELIWEDDGKSVLRVRGAGRPHRAEPVTVNVGNAGAVLRLLLGLGALLPEITFITDYPQSLGKRPNRDLLDTLTMLGATCEARGPDGCLPITIRGGSLYGGRVTVSGARSSQFLSSLLYLGPLLDEPLEIAVVDGLKSRMFVRMTLNVLREAGIAIEHDSDLRHFTIPPRRHYQPRSYVVPGDYPSAAALMAACAVARDPASELRLEQLRPGEEDGEALIRAFLDMGADITREGGALIMRGGRVLHGIQMNGDTAIDCIPALVAAACFAEGESVFFNIETLHYKESDRIDDLCAELRKAGCTVEPRRDAIIVRGQSGGIAGGVRVDGHADHRLVMALAVAALGSRDGLVVGGAEHVAKSYPHFFQDLGDLGVPLSLN